MAALNESDFIKEAVFCIKESDAVKAKALLQYFPDISAPFQNRVLYEISNAHDDMAYTLIEYISELVIEDDDVREKLYEVIMDKAYKSPDFVLRLIESGSPDNKRVILKVIKDLKLSEAVPSLLDILVQETEISLLCETLKVMSKIGDDSCIPVIADFVFYDDESLKAAAVFSLSELRTPLALEALKEISCTPKVDQHVIDTVAASIDLLESILYDDVKDQTSSGCETADCAEGDGSEDFQEEGDNDDEEDRESAEHAGPAGDLRDVPPVHDRLMDMLRSGDFFTIYEALNQLMCTESSPLSEIEGILETDDNDLKINILKILDFINDQDSLDIVKKLFYSKPSGVNLKFAIYETIKNFPRFKSTISVVDGVEDRNELVRMACCRAVNRFISDVHIAGIKSKIEAGGIVPRRIVETIVDSQADNIFESLIGSDTFIHLATHYLSRNARESIRNHYIEYLINRGNASLAGAIGAVSGEGDDMPAVFLVHSSVAVQQYLGKVLHAAGFHLYSFSTPGDAVMGLSQNIPELIITDLYLDEIDGVSFADKFTALFEENAPEVILLSEHTEPGLPENLSYGFSHVSAGKAIIEKVKNSINREKEGVCRELSLDGINRMMVDSCVGLRPAAWSLMEDFGRDALEILYGNFKDRDPLLVIPSMSITGRIGNEDAAEALHELAVKSEHPAVQAEAYKALGSLSFLVDKVDVQALFRIKNDCTRFSAVGYLDRCFNGDIIDVIKNLTEKGDSSSKKIAGDIIDASAYNLFMKLMRFDTFAYLAILHLAHNVHQYTRDIYLDMLQARGFNSAVRAVQGEVHTYSSGDDNIVVIISDSSVRLSVLTSRLTHRDLSLVPMKSMEDALDMLMMLNPSIIITDLFNRGRSVLDSLRILKREKGAACPPVVVITEIEEFRGFSPMDSGARIIDDDLNCFGIKHVLNRPIDFKKLKSCVGSAVTCVKV